MALRRLRPSLVSAVGIVLGLLGALVDPARAAAPARTAPRPPEVLGQIDVAAPAPELSRWVQSVGRLVPGGPVPTLADVTRVLARLVGAGTLDGLDWKKPVHLVFLHPQRYPEPIVLVAALESRVRLKASLKTSGLVVRAQRGFATLGSAAALEAVGAYAATRAHVPTPEGLHGLVFLGPVWAAFGDTVRAFKAVMASPKLPAGSGAALDAVIAAVEQSTDLAIDLSAGRGGPELQLALTAKPGSAVDQVVSAQRPSDFALAGKLGNAATEVFAAGTMVIEPLKDALNAMLFGQDMDPKLRADMDALYALWTGDVAMAGAIGVAAGGVAPEAISYAYLMGAKDGARAAALFPRMHEAMTRAGLLKGQVTLARTPLPAFQHGGATVEQAEFQYDFSKLPSYTGKKQFATTLAWSGWDALVAFAMGSKAPDQIRRLLDAARAGAAGLPSSVQAAIERARANRESLVIRIDLGALGRAGGAQVALPTALAPTVAFGFGLHTARLRVTLADER